MNILEAQLANEIGTSIALSTAEEGEILLSTEGEDYSGGWRFAYNAWCAAGNVPKPYKAPLMKRTVEEHLESYGYTMLALMNLKDLEDGTGASSKKAIAVKKWLSQVQLAYALGKELKAPPFKYSEILKELAKDNGK